VSKRILLIDSDEGFAQGLSKAIKARGFAATLATDSEQGMSLAKKHNPDLIVVCVEAQPTNGYMLCTRLKKDDQLKAIPVILTSAHATPDSFEKHKKLKTRAEEYLIKPFAPQAVLEKASRLLGVTLPPAAGAKEDAGDDEPLALGDLMDGDDEPISLSAADVAEARSALTEDPLVVEEVEEVVEIQEEGGDDELEMFDKAFDSLGSGGGQAGPATTSRFADGQSANVPEKAKREPTELSAPDDDAVLRSLTREDEAAPRPVARSGNGKSEAAARLKQELKEKDRELLELKEQARGLKEDAVKREAAAKALQQRADALAAAAKKLEREKGGGSDDLKTRVKQLEKELEATRSELTAAQGEKDLLAEERDELKRQLEEVQASAGQNENRAVKAYAKIKNEEKLREKARKALEIALQLLETAAERDDDESEKSA
jgi:DNA-binding response OmpR family regulator